MAASMVPEPLKVDSKFIQDMASLEYNPETDILVYSHTHTMTPCETQFAGIRDRSNAWKNHR